MATQNPIILSGGGLSQIPAGDTIAPAALGTGTPVAGKVLDGSGAWIYPPATISAKTAAYTVVAADADTIINCTSGTFTVSLTAAATLGAGFQCWVWNTSTTSSDAVTIDPSGAETIDGVATLSIRRGEGVQIICTGTAWQTGGKKAMRGYAENFSTTSRAICTADGALALGQANCGGVQSVSLQTADSSSSYGAQSSYSFSYGRLSLANGTNSSAFGESCSANGLRSCAIGYGSTALSQDSFALGYGAYSESSGKFSYANGYFSTVVGSAQRSTLVLRAQTADATPTQLTTNGSAPASLNRLSLRNFSAFAISGMVVATSTLSSSTSVAAWKIEALARRSNNAASVVLVSSTVTAISNAPGWALAISADTTNGAVAFTFTGAAATNIRVVADIQTAEVTYA